MELMGALNMTTARLIHLALITLIVSGCSSMPPEPKPLPTKKRTALNAPSLALNSPALAYWLVWDYTDTNNIRFEVWRSNQVTGPFSYWTNIAERSVLMPVDKPQQFFILRASNTVTHAVSDWSK
jgi:hypothetical protein